MNSRQGERPVELQSRNIGNTDLLYGRVFIAEHKTDDRGPSFTLAIFLFLAIFTHITQFPQHFLEHPRALDSSSSHQGSDSGFGGSGMSGILLHSQVSGNPLQALY